MAEETKRSTIRLKSKTQSSEDKKIDTKKSVKEQKLEWIQVLKNFRKKN